MTRGIDGKVREVEVLRGGLDCSPELLPTAARSGRGRTRRPEYPRHEQKCHRGAPRCSERNWEKKRGEGVLGTPEMDLDGVGSRRTAGTAWWRGEDGDGGKWLGRSGGSYRGLGVAFLRLNARIEEGFQWRVMAMKARATSARGEG